MQMNLDFMILRRILQPHLNLVLGLQMRKHVVVITRTPQGRMENCKKGNEALICSLVQLGAQ